ncbi:endonuclease [Opitutus sp. ER46]|nr:endonuclease [Opitutus sp. ER46]
MPASTPRSWFILILLAVTAVSVSAQDLVLGTYNLRNDNAGDVQRGNGWKERVPFVAGLIRFHGFDVLGTQEALYHQLEDVARLVEGYAWVGVGRDDGARAGEFAAIFYRTEAVAVRASGTFWFSPTKTVPSKGWDSNYRRICTWAKLEQRATGFVFFVFNVHFDHKGHEARRNSARMLLEEAKAIAGDAPVVLMGDFNSDQKTEYYQTLAGAGWVKDARELSPVRYEPNGTFNNFLPDAWTPARIDHIFLSRAFAVKRYGVLTDSYRARLPAESNAGGKDQPDELNLERAVARMPSDHFPVLVETTKAGGVGAPAR